MKTPREITSRTNPSVKAAVTLRDSAKHRREQRRFFIEGLRLCRDAFQSGIEIECLFVTRGAYEKNCGDIEKIAGPAKETLFISDGVAQRLSDTVNPQGIFCVCKTPEISFTPKREGKYILLQNVADPSNVGAIIRTAEALGLDGAVLSKGGCDIFNPKALRASMGSIFRLPVAVAEDMTAAVSKMTAEGFLTVASVVSPKARSVTEIDLGSGCAVVIGNEANGVSQDLIDVCSLSATIPMKGRAESFNAANAATIIMWEMMR